MKPGDDLGRAGLRISPATSFPEEGLDETVDALPRFFGWACVNASSSRRTMSVHPAVPLDRLRRQA
jgi:hypothetical protein